MKFCVFRLSHLQKLCSNWKVCELNIVQIVLQIEGPPSFIAKKYILYCKIVDQLGQLCCMALIKNDGSCGNEDVLAWLT